MTRRLSQRARAQEIYREMTQANTECPLPNPPPQAGEGKVSAGAGETRLTAGVRALYENSAVPVREIARVAGVTERTLYKYARKGGWRPRYAWIDRGGAARRRRRAKEGAAQFAPAQGAGGRFIARADKDKPFARGLKATDPEGAARASAVCAEAEAIAVAAQADALWLQWHETFIACLRTVRATRDELAASRDGRRELVFNRVGHVALDYLEFCQARIAMLPIPGATLDVSRQRGGMGKS